MSPRLGRAGGVFALGQPAIGDVANRAAHALVGAVGEAGENLYRQHQIAQKRRARRLDPLEQVTACLRACPAESPGEREPFERAQKQAHATGPSARGSFARNGSRVATTSARSGSAALAESPAAAGSGP